MTETTTTENRTTKPSASFDVPQFEMPKFDMAKFNMAKIEIPAEFREFAERGVAQAKDAYEKAKAATEQVNGLLKDTYTTAARGATDYNLKVIEIVRANTNTAFECMQAILAAKSPSEFIELSTSQARKQFEAMTAQSKELAELAQKVTASIAEPLKTGVAETINRKPA